MAKVELHEYKAKGASLFDKIGQLLCFESKRGLRSGASGWKAWHGVAKLPVCCNPASRN